MSEEVFVAEVGHGARPGRVLRRYVSDKPGEAGDRAVVKLDEFECPRDCFASSVFASRYEANDAVREA